MKNTVQFSLKETKLKTLRCRNKLTLLLLLMASAGFSQQPANGQFLIGGSNEEGVGNVIQLSDGDYLFANSTRSYNGTGNLDLLLIRFNPDFSIEWEKTFGGSGNEYIHDRGCLLENADGTLTVLASTTSYGVGDADAMLFKMDAAGNLLWSKTYGGIGKERLGVLRHAPSGGYIIGGSTDSYTTSAGSAERNLMLTRVDTSGNVIWQKAYARNNYVSSVQIADILPLSTGEFLMVGTFQAATNSSLSFISKVDAAGAIVWFNTYVSGANGWEIIAGLTLKDNSTAFAVGMTSQHATEGPADGLILSIDISSGNVNWSKTYDAPTTNSQEWFYCIKKEQHNKYVINMYENSTSGLGNFDIGLFAIDSTGNVLGQPKAFGTALSEHSKWFDQTLDGGYILSGISGIGSSADGYLVKVDSNWNSGCNEQNIGLTADSIYITPSAYTPTTISSFHDTLPFPLSFGSVMANVTPLCCYTQTFTATQTACDSLTWIDGVTYTASNSTATHTLTAATGCDSVVTLDLTIITSSTSTDIQTACNSYTWIDGNTYAASNNTAQFVISGGAANGCDSIISLDFTTLSNTGTDTQTACDTYTWIDGNTYSASNSTATHTLTNTAGCDSVVTLNLTINYATSSIDAVQACDSYTWIDGVTYTANNDTATHTIANGTANGCDSVVFLNLTINPLDLTISTTNDTTMANAVFQLGATYQWLDCDSNNAIIPGATGWTYDPPMSGNYAVQITLYGCVDTTTCVEIYDYTSIDELSNTNFSIYPNPVRNVLTIATDDKLNNVIIYAINGQVITTITNPSNKELDVSNLKRGMYIIAVQTNEGVAQTKFIKE